MRKNIYFASDLHLGSPDYKASIIRERKFVDWLTAIQDSALELYLVGDIFDFWFEYRTVVPKGYFLLFSKLAEYAELQIPVTILTGNHDLWYDDFFPDYLGVQVAKKPILRNFFGKKYFIAHGDGLGPGDYGYKILKRILSFKPNQWLFRWIHPDIGIRLALLFSKTSNRVHHQKMDKFLGDREFTYQFAKEYIHQGNSIDYFIFGHRHIAYQQTMPKGATYFLLGDWINLNSYVLANANQVTLNHYPNQNFDLKT